MMIAQQPLQVSREAGSSSLVVWLCDPFDREFSFRARLAEIEKTLGAVVELPPEEVGEDFVEGRLIWAMKEFCLCFERSLGYAQFSSPSSEDVGALLNALEPRIGLRRRQARAVD
jgi:hypothetical protein